MTDPALGTTSGGIATNSFDLKALVRKHLGDPTHVFTDEEISDVVAHDYLTMVAQHYSLRQRA